MLYLSLLVAVATLAPQGPPPSAPLVNAPVAPEAIYVARQGTPSGLSVIDLNGFGLGTGDPTFLPVFGPASEGTSMAPFNPNLAFQGSLLTPPIGPGSSTLDGGSSGVFTLTRDTNLGDLHRPVDAAGEVVEVGRLADMMLGHPLDVVFNNGPLPFGCQAGGGSLCATTGLKLVGAVGLLPSPSSAPVPIQLGGGFGDGTPGAGNPITWAPHPNPPPLIQPALCAYPHIGGAEPTATASHQQGFVNLLGPGDAQGDPALGIPPSGLVGPVATGQFVGPSAPAPTPIACAPFQLRQQVGHFLYAIEKRTRRVLVLNSNRMTLLDAIPLADPTELAMDPNLRFLAVTNRNFGTVDFIDIDPTSATFHQVVKTTRVGAQPIGIAWQPDDEDVLVCNSADRTLSLISTATLEVRRTVPVGQAAPFRVVATPRHQGYGSFSSVYYAWILDTAGQLWLFESGPDGINGWGYDAVVTRLGYPLRGARQLQLDPNDPALGVWVVHDQAIDVVGAPADLPGGAVTRLELDVPVSGQQPLPPGSTPGPRGKTITVSGSIGVSELSGRPTDLAFDNLSNLGVYRGLSTPFSASAPAPVNSKHPMRAAAPATPTNRASFLFLPVGGARVDVVDLATGKRVDTNVFQPGVQSIPAPGAFGVMDYFRQ